MKSESYTCPCCGYVGLNCPAYADLRGDELIRGAIPPYSTKFGLPSYEVCKCCGFEFGNDDEPGTGKPMSFEGYLHSWESSGCQWFDKSLRPNGWSLSGQLRSFWSHQRDTM
jgi:hypothetical protein